MRSLRLARDRSACRRVPRDLEQPKRGGCGRLLDEGREVRAPEIGIQPRLVQPLRTPGAASGASYSSTHSSGARADAVAVCVLQFDDACKPNVRLLTVVGGN